MDEVSSQEWPNEADDKTYGDGKYHLTKWHLEIQLLLSRAH